MGLFTLAAGTANALYNALPNHPGSWGGLPDFGVTEAAAQTISGGRTSDLSKATSGAVKGSSTSSSQNIISPVPGKPGNTNYNIPSTGGGGGSGTSQLDQLRAMAREGSLNPVQRSELERLEASSRDYAAEARNAINSGYDSYFGELDNMLNQGLPSQRTAQEDIARSQYDQGVNQLSSQRTLGMQDLQGQREKATTQQNRTLKDISENVRNLFQSGNTYLGSLGAGDSSAANQYAYALTKLGSKQRGDVQSQYADIQNDIGGRETRLNEIYNSEVNNLASQRDQQISTIASWFAEQQNALRQAKAQGQLSRGQDLASLSQNLLNNALQQLNNIQAEAANRRAALDQWAMSNAENITQLRNNLQTVSTINPIFPQAQALNGVPQLAPMNGSNFAPIGFGSRDDERQGFFA